MKRFLIAASIAAVLAPGLAAPSYAQDADGRSRGGRGDGQFQGRGDRAGDRGDRGGRGGFQGQPQPQQVQPAPAAPQAQRQDRGQFQGGQRQGLQDRGQFQGQGQRQDRGQFQGQRQERGQFQGQGQRNFGQNDGRRFDDRNRGGFDNRQGFQGRQGIDRFDNRNFSSRRYQGAAPRGGQRFSYQGRDFYRFRTQPYSWPRGYNYNSVSWSLNQLLPSIFWNQNSYYIDPYQYGLPWADPGYRWVRVGADALLVDTYTGMIVDMAPDVFYW